MCSQRWDRDCTVLKDQNRMTSLTLPIDSVDIDNLHQIITHQRCLLVNIVNGENR